MSGTKFPYIILDQNKSQLEDDSDFSENGYKNTKFKIQKYEKFKPKSIMKENNNKVLKGAENKVKYLLSIFLKNIESEDYNTGIFKHNNTLKIKDKDKDNVSIKKKRIKKINTATNNKFGRTNSFCISSNNENKINIYNTENHKFNFRVISPKASLFSNAGYKKKVGFNINPINISNTDSQKEGHHIFKKKTKKKYNLGLSNTIIKKNNKNENLKRTKSNNTDINKDNKIYYSMCESPKIKSNIFPTNTNERVNSNKIKKNLTNKKKLINKTQSQGQIKSYLNFKNGGIMLNKNNNDNKEHKKKKKITFKNLINIVNNNININNINNKNNNNDSNYNSIISERSDCNLNKKSIELKSKNNTKYDELNKERNSDNSLKNKNSSNKIIRDIILSPILTKKNSIELTDLNFKNNLLKKTSLNHKITKDTKNSLIRKPFKRSETTILKKDNQFINKDKFRRLNRRFKTLKEQIKKLIILRPDENKYTLNENDKDSKSSSIYKNEKNKVINNNVFSFGKNNKTSKSNTNLIKIKPNINIDIINKSEIKKKNKSNNNNIIINVNLSEQINSILKSNKKEEKQENKKTDSSKSVSDFSIHSIKRKNNIYYEKYRKIIHKGVIYDSLDDEELEDEEEINSFYIDPHSIFNITFDSILLIISVISLFEIPIYLATNHNFCRANIRYIDLVNLCIECIYITDLFLGFLRAYYNWDEQLIKKNKKIAFKYFSGWFLLDLIASIPVYTLIKLHEPSCNEKELSSKYYNIVLNNLNYLFICNRLLKILKIFSYNQAWKTLTNKLNDYWNMIINIALVLAALNYTACLYIFIARNSYPNWILHSNLETQSFKDIYICAIYILIMALTTVGYGDITCYSLIERIFQILLLVIGIMAYSWLVSSFSNYIQKLNEKYADFEKRKSVLDEIKVSNPNLPDSLYERILRYLKFKNFHEKKLKNIIFDCLPVGLKNNLISEMYKPIIKNFIFFKNFQNTDFIVRVILCFKPIIAYKNDILVNEGDMIEEIMFVKRGVLSVELPINMTNPKENIDKYFNMPLLRIEKGPNVQKIGNSTIIGNNKEYQDMINSIKEKENIYKNQNNNINNYIKTTTMQSSMNYSLSLGNNQTINKKNSIKIKTTYVKILRIRENEHFGDVLMFLEQRCPLRLRVRSKKCELYFLKKMDALKISTSYQNIWRRINKKSVFNFEQIKKTIRKIVEIYCSEKKVDSLNDEESSDDLINTKFGIKESGIGLHPQNYDLNTSALNSKKLIVIRRNQSLKDGKIKNLKDIFKDKDINNDYFLINNKYINNKKKCFSTRIQKKKFDLLINENKLVLSSFSSSSSSSLSSSSKNNKKKRNKNKKKSKLYSKDNTKLLDVFNRNYKYYKGIHNNNIEEKTEKRASIITEESPDKESSLTHLKYTNSKMTRLSSIKRKIKSNSNKGTIKEDIDPINEKENEDEDMNNIKTSKIRLNSSLLNEWNKHNTNAKGNNYDISYSNKTSYEKGINIEIYSNEIIKVNNDDNLLYKKIDLNEKVNVNDLNSLKYNNNKIESLLNSFEKKSKSESHKYQIFNLEKKDKHSSIGSDIKDEQYVKINNNNSNNKFSDKSNYLNIKSNISSKNNIVSSLNMEIKENWDSNLLTINSTISLQFDSSSENYNFISGE